MNGRREDQKHADRLRHYWVQPVRAPCSFVSEVTAVRSLHALDRDNRFLCALANITQAHPSSTRWHAGETKSPRISPTLIFDALRHPTFYWTITTKEQGEDAKREDAGSTRWRSKRNGGKRVSWMHDMSRGRRRPVLETTRIAFLSRGVRRKRFTVGEVSHFLQNWRKPS